MRGEFSRLPLGALLAADVDVCAVLVPGENDHAVVNDQRTDAGVSQIDVSQDCTPVIQGRDTSPLRQLIYQPPPRSTLPLLTRAHEPSIITLAWERDIPVLELRRERDPAVVRTLAAYQPDVLCVACWPRRLPTSLLALGRLGCLNLHPALLPRHRGPAPLFWTLRHGDPTAGITVHLMDTTLDGGDILAQKAIALPDGIAGAELERRCAEAGGRLLAETIFALAQGIARRKPQPPSAGSYEPWPAPADLVITPDHSARWAFNFIRGAAHWAWPLVIVVAGHRFVVRDALDYTSTGSVSNGYRLAGDELWLACAPGVLHATIEA